MYLSPAVDCFDGLPVAWRIGKHPNADPVNGMLDDVIAILKDDAKPIIHTDRDCPKKCPHPQECLKHKFIPFIVEDKNKHFYYRGLKEFLNEPGYLIDACYDGQDPIKRLLEYFDIEHALD